jgi:hypothetical protein
MPTKTFTFFFASGATGSNKQFVGPHMKMALVCSGVTFWNAGTGNASISVRGGLSETDTHADILPVLNISTITAKGVYVLSSTGLPYMSLGLGTATTGSTSVNNIDVVLYTDDL